MTVLSLDIGIKQIQIHQLFLERASFRQAISVMHFLSKDALNMGCKTGGSSVSLHAEFALEAPEFTVQEPTVQRSHHRTPSPIFPPVSLIRNKEYWVHFSCHIQKVSGCSWAVNETKCSEAAEILEKLPKLLTSSAEFC